MSSGWTQSQQQGSAHAPYEEVWTQQRDDDVPWQDPSQDAVGPRGAEPWIAGPGDTERWVAGQGGAQPWVAGQGGTEPWVAGQGGTEPWVAGQRGAEPWVAGHGGAGYQAGYSGSRAVAPEGSGYSEPWGAGHGETRYSDPGQGRRDQPEPWAAGYGEAGYSDRRVSGPGESGYYPGPGPGESGYYPGPGPGESGYYPGPGPGQPGESGYYSEPWVVAQGPPETRPPGQRGEAGYSEPWAEGRDRAGSWLAGPGDAVHGDAVHGDAVHGDAVHGDRGYPESSAAVQGRAEPWSAAAGNSQSSARGPEPWWARQNSGVYSEPQQQPPQAAEQPAAPAQSWDKPAQSYQQEWDQAASSSADDADYDWYRYLGQGLSSQAKPAAVAPPPLQHAAADNSAARPTQTEPDGARRRGFSRSRRGKSPATVADQGSSERESTGPGYGRLEEWRPEASRADLTDPGFGRVEQPHPAVGQADYKQPTQFSSTSAPARADVGQTLAGQPEHTDESPQVGDTGLGRRRHGTPAGTRRSAAPVPGRRLRGRQSSPSAAGAVPAPLKRQPDRQESVQRQPQVREPVKREAGYPAPATRVRTAAPANRNVLEEPAAQPARSASRADRPRRAGRRLSVRRVGLLVGGAVVLAGAATTATVLAGSGAGVAHVMVTPTRLGNYVQAPLLAQNMGAAALQKQIVASSGGEAKHVVYAVYEDATGPAAQHGPQIILFIGANLSGTSSGSFMGSFMGKLQGAATTSAGSMGGAAACVPSVGGRLAECAWADNDTFGVVASPTLGAAALASEMRAVRPLVEKRTS